MSIREVMDFENYNNIFRGGKMSKRPRLKCNNCGFTGTRGAFKMSLEYSHDVVCPSCGSTLIDTSKMLEAHPRYIYGSNNTRKPLGMTK